MSWKNETLIGGNMEWKASFPRFGTEEEALDHARAIRDRWFSVREIRAVESRDKVNARWTDGELILLGEIA